MHLSSWMWVGGKLRIVLTSFILNLWLKISGDHLQLPTKNLTTYCIIYSPTIPINLDELS